MAFQAPTNEQKNALAREFMNLPFPQILTAKLVVEHHPNGRIGIDTTRMFGSLDKKEQEAHSLRIKPDGLDAERLRSVRRSDVIVRFVSGISREIHVEVDVRTDSVIFTLNKIPKRILERKKDQIYADLCTILGPVTVLPKLN